MNGGGELDLVGHTVSAGGGAALTLILDRVVKFFVERDRRKEEIKLAERLTSIESKLERLLDESKSRGELAGQLARLDERLKALESDR